MRRAVPAPATPAFTFPSWPFTLDELEVSLLKQAMEQCSGNQQNAARILGITRYALRWRLKKHGLYQPVYAPRRAMLDTSPAALMEL